MLVPAVPPAVTVAGDGLGGEELRAAAGAVADRVIGAAVVAVDATPSLDTVVGVLGCLLAGAAAVPVPPDSGARERAHLLADSEARLWLGERAMDVPVEMVRVDVPARSLTAWAEPDDGPALAVYTSGTPARRRVRCCPAPAVAACLDGLRDAWQWGAG